MSVENSLKMDARISIVTLGVTDLKKSKTFYEKLGWSASSASQENIIFFQAGGIVLALYPRDLLAEDAKVDTQGSGFRGFTLAQNVSSKEEVSRALKVAEAAGGKILKPAQDVFWGGHSGYFADPDGNLWEIAWNPFLELTKEGLPKLP
jgi:catechol 2,3-dioxygenase-like lactoylglutathione lyase family enzyme